MVKILREGDLLEGLGAGKQICESIIYIYDTCIFISQVNPIFWGPKITKQFYRGPEHTHSKGDPPTTQNTPQF